MLRLLMVLVMSGLLHETSAFCQYSNYGQNDSILVANDNCKVSTVCRVNNECLPTYFKNATAAFTDVTAVGDMKNFASNELTIRNTQGLLVNDMSLPDVVTALNFEGISGLDLINTSTISWPSVQILRIVSCNNTLISNSTNWPPQLINIAIKIYQLNAGPQGLPASVKRIEIQYSGLTDLNFLPERNDLQFLNFHNNSIQQVINKDWRTMKTLRLSGNPLQTFAFVQLSSNLQYFNIMGCNLNNITIDVATADALNALKPFDGRKNQTGFAVDKDIMTNSIVCEVIGGVIKPLFQNQTKFSVTACVLQDSSLSHVKKTASESTNTWVIVGLAIGVVVLILFALFIYRQRNTHRKDGNYIGTRTGTEGSEGTDTGLDLSTLRLHRLELSDLIVTSAKPLASGAYGEVWMGTYGSNIVAIKRLKSRDPRQVQMFINEISLWSQLESRYIVKFIGASWTRPIEIECVVEYMDLGDLRSYLVNQSSQQFTWDQKFQVITSIVSGLIYLHTYVPLIIHRDLKSRNVLLDSVKGTKLTDFGTSRSIEEDETMTTGIGTYQWMAPEIISGTKYSSAADIYSFGIILSELCTHQVPYSNLQQNGKPLTQLYILNGVCAGWLRPSFEGVNIPAWVNNLATQCLQLNASDRPTALQLSAMLHRYVS